MNPLIEYILSNKLEYGIDMGETSHNLHSKTEEELNNIIDRVNIYIIEYKLHHLNEIKHDLQLKVKQYKHDLEMKLLMYRR